MVSVKPAMKIVWGLAAILMAPTALPATAWAQESRSPVPRQAQDRAEHGRSPVADAAQAGDRATVRALLRPGHCVSSVNR